MADNTLQDGRLRTLSLFSGIGGIDIGLQPWCRTVCYCEIDSYAVGILTKQMAKGHIDTAPVWDDVTTFGRSEIEAVGPIEAITGGFPCQDISCAGKGAGLEGERSGLFFEIARLVRLVRPKLIFLENVPALLVRGMGRVLGELSESGYDARWRVLSAAEMGAPHKRNRIWIMAHPKSLSPIKGKPFAGRSIVRNCRKIYHEGEGNKYCVADTQRKGLEKFKRQPGNNGEKYQTVERNCNSGEWWAVEPDVGRVAHGVPFRVDRLRCLGNAVVPLQARTAFELLTAAERMEQT